MGFDDIAWLTFCVYVIHTYRGDRPAGVAALIFVCWVGLVTTP